MSSDASAATQADAPAPPLDTVGEKKAVTFKTKNGKEVTFYRSKKALKVKVPKVPKAPKAPKEPKTPRPGGLRRSPRFEVPAA
jgi:hypothetical protein